MPEKRARRPAGTGRCGGARPGRRLGTSAGGRSKHLHSRAHLVLRFDRTARAAAAVKLSRRVARASTLSLPHRVSSLGCRSPPPARVLPSRNARRNWNERKPSQAAARLKRDRRRRRARARRVAAAQPRAALPRPLGEPRLAPRRRVAHARARRERCVVRRSSPTSCGKSPRALFPPRLYVRCLIDWEV